MLTRERGPRRWPSPSLSTLRDPILPDKLSLFGGVVVPPRLIERVGDEAFAEHPVGTGPFSFVHWQRDHEVRMRAFDGHPGTDQLVFSAAPNAASSLAALQSGGVDLVADAAQQLKGYAAIAARDESPLRRDGTPAEFGRTAAFLLSPSASYLTGIMMPVDGGMRHGF